MIIDTHAHLNFEAFEKDFNKVIKKCLDNDIWMINVGSQYDTSKKAVEIANNYKKGVFAAVGIHPIHAEEEMVTIEDDSFEVSFKARGEVFNYTRYKKLATNNKVVAIGEVGLDYYDKPKSKKKRKIFKKKQKELLLGQLKLAKELDLPVIFHCRMAHDDLIELLEENSSLRPKKAVMHCFVGRLEDLKKYLSFGFYIGFNGIIFKKPGGIDLDEIIKETPLNRILIETDCPFLTPPQIDQKRNEPIFIKYILKRISKVRGDNFNELSEVITNNTRRFFQI